MTDSIGASPKALQRAQVMSALKTASNKTGADFDYLVKTAQRESNFDPGAKASTSSATGLFQFTNETWVNMLERYGAKHGVNTDGLSREQMLELRKDASLSATMAGELAGENGKILAKKLGREATSAELYTAHFMGPSDAARLIEAARDNKPGMAADMFPRAALANANVFSGADGAKLSPAQLYTKLTGVDVKLADAGLVSSGVMPNQQSNQAALLQAKLGTAALNSSLMMALFGLQEDRG
ncbi:MAG TPA: transglycosylase SLT domain-containing protein [Hyphomonadaceae bacterium]|nr:transglycosylase SLT domain-containing protein [Hyphomonadaceae bacterium]HPN05140.1 transglycosylase SLT domain-containing protein [Hyphomonadaceae bacterium]